MVDSDGVLNGSICCRQLFEITSDAALILQNGRIVVANEQCQCLFGVLPDQLSGRFLVDLVEPIHHRTIASQCEFVTVQLKPSYLPQLVIRRLDGHQTAVESRALPLPGADGCTAVLIMLRTIPETAANVGVGTNETQVQNIVDTAMDGIISMDADQRIMLFNAAAEEIFGCRAEEVLGQSIDVLIPNRFHRQHRCDVEKFGRGVIRNRRMGMQRTVSALRASGEEFPIEASISQTSVRGQKIYTVILRDVTESLQHRKQIEQQAMMLDQVTDAVNVVDLEGRIRFWNQAASRLYGWAAEEVLGRNAIEILYRGDPETLETMLREVHTRCSWSGELTKTTRSGKAVVVEHRRTMLQEESGAASGFLCIDIDITDRKKRERASHRSQRLESIGTLAGGIAHDLNNVLTPILLGTRLLATGRVASDCTGLLETMQASAQRGAHLIKQLLAFAGGIRGERSPVRMDQLVIETRHLLMHTLSQAIQISTHVEENCPTVLGDATELSQILLNLSINARDAMPDGGTLTIEVIPTQLDSHTGQFHPDAQPGKYVLLKITDTGSGMTTEILDRIFEPFFTTKDQGKGSGLGLATVQGIVKSHCGFINVYSEPGQGSRFSVYLPATPDGNAVLQDIPVESDADSGSGHTILLVDDERDILRMTAAVMEANGYRVFTARDGAEAISLFSRHGKEISAVLLDMMMPGLDGLHTIDLLKRIDPDVVVIACSGLRTSQRESEMLQRGAKAFVPKPYTEIDLLQTLSRVMREKNRR